MLAFRMRLRPQIGRALHARPRPMSFRCTLLVGGLGGALGLSAMPSLCAQETAHSLAGDKLPDTFIHANSKPESIIDPKRTTAALLCWSFFASVWFVSITMPAALMWAVITAKWRLTSALLAAFCFPHLVTLPPLPRSCSHAFWHALQGWFPDGIQVIHLRLSEPEPEPAIRGERRLFCIHPHGIYTLGALALPDHMPDVRLCIAPYLYHFAPVFRIVAQLLGVKLGSTGPNDLKQLMQDQQTPLAIVPGGFEEATVTCRGTERVYLKTRAGFVKYALRHGYDLVPCFTVGDSDMFSNPQGAWRFRWWLNTLSIPAVIPFGFPLLPLLPKRVHVRLAIGPALHVPHIKNPTRDDVEKHRKRYVAALKATYNEAVRGTASEGRQLEVW